MPLHPDDHEALWYAIIGYMVTFIIVYHIIGD